MHDAEDEARKALAAEMARAHRRGCWRSLCSSRGAAAGNWNPRAAASTLAGGGAVGDGGGGRRGSTSATIVPSGGSGGIMKAEAGAAGTWDQKQDLHHHGPGAVLGNGSGSAMQSPAASASKLPLLASSPPPSTSPSVTSAAAGGMIATSARRAGTGAGAGDGDPAILSPAFTLHATALTSAPPSPGLPLDPLVPDASRAQSRSHALTLAPAASGHDGAGMGGVVTVYSAGGGGTPLPGARQLHLSANSSADGSSGGGVARDIAAAGVGLGRLQGPFVDVSAASSAMLLPHSPDPHHRGSDMGHGRTWGGSSLPLLATGHDSLLLSPTADPRASVAAGGVLSPIGTRLFAEGPASPAGAGSSTVTASAAATAIVGAVARSKGGAAGPAAKQAATGRAKGCWSCCRQPARPSTADPSSAAAAAGDAAGSGSERRTASPSDIAAAEHMLYARIEAFRRVRRWVASHDVGDSNDRQLTLLEALELNVDAIRGDVDVLGEFLMGVAGTMIEGPGAGTGAGAGAGTGHALSQAADATAVIGPTSAAGTASASVTATTPTGVHLRADGALLSHGSPHAGASNPRPGSGVLEKLASRHGSASSLLQLQLQPRDPVRQLFAAAGAQLMQIHRTDSAGRMSVQHSAASAAELLRAPPTSVPGSLFLGTEREGVSAGAGAGAGSVLDFAARRHAGAGMQAAGAGAGAAGTRKHVVPALAMVASPGAGPNAATPFTRMSSTARTGRQQTTARSAGAERHLPSITPSGTTGRGSSQGAAAAGAGAGTGAGGSSMRARFAAFKRWASGNEATTGRASEPGSPPVMIPGSVPTSARGEGQMRVPVSTSGPLALAAQVAAQRVQAALNSGGAGHGRSASGPDGQLSHIRTGSATSSAAVERLSDGGSASSAASLAARGQQRGSGDGSPIVIGGDPRLHSRTHTRTRTDATNTLTAGDDSGADEVSSPFGTLESGRPMRGMGMLGGRGGHTSSGGLGLDSNRGLAAQLRDVTAALYELQRAFAEHVRTSTVRVAELERTVAALQRNQQYQYQSHAPQEALTMTMYTTGSDIRNAAAAIVSPTGSASSAAAAGLHLPSIQAPHYSSESRAPSSPSGHAEYEALLRSGMRGGSSPESASGSIDASATAAYEGMMRGNEGADGATSPLAEPVSTSASAAAGASASSAAADTAGRIVSAEAETVNTSATAAAVSMGPRSGLSIGTAPRGGAGSGGIKAAGGSGSPVASAPLVPLSPPAHTGPRPWQNAEYEALLRRRSTTGQPAPADKQAEPTEKPDKPAAP